MTEVYIYVNGVGNVLAIRRSKIGSHRLTDALISPASTNVYLLVVPVVLVSLAAVTRVLSNVVFRGNQDCPFARLSAAVSGSQLLLVRGCPPGKLARRAVLLGLVVVGEPLRASVGFLREEVRQLMGSRVVISRVDVSARPGPFRIAAGGGDGVASDILPQGAEGGHVGRQYGNLHLGCRHDADVADLPDEIISHGESVDDDEAEARDDDRGATGRDDCEDLEAAFHRHLEREDGAQRKDEDGEIDDDELGEQGMLAMRLVSIFLRTA